MATVLDRKLILFSPPVLPRSGGLLSPPSLFGSSLGSAVTLPVPRDVGALVLSWSVGAPVDLLPVGAPVLSWPVGALVVERGLTYGVDDVQRA
jgi:hypothetical protein